LQAWSFWTLRIPPLVDFIGGIHGEIKIPNKNRYISIHDDEFNASYPQIKMRSAVPLFNIPLFMYIESIMKGGPEIFGYVDGLFSMVALLTGLALSKKVIPDLPSLLKVSIFESFSLAVLFCIIGIWRPSIGLWPYILLPMVGVFSTALKIHSRSLVLKTHSSDELNEFTVFYQAFGNIFLVLGAVSAGYIVEHYGVMGAFLSLATVLIFFGVCATVLRSERSNSTGVSPHGARLTSPSKPKTQLDGDAT
jgi:hypothetical protein